LAQLIIYGTGHCSKCLMTEQLLTIKGIPFNFVNLENQPALMDKIMQKVYPNTSLPIIQVDDTFHCISNPQEVFTLLK